MGSQVVPRFTVFHTFPEDTPTYQTLRFRGSTATSLIRPEASAGPMFRRARVWKSAEVSSWAVRGATRPRPTDPARVRKKERIVRLNMNLSSGTELGGETVEEASVARPVSM
jgi:hypothetical protein